MNWLTLHLKDSVAVNYCQIPWTESINVHNTTKNCEWMRADGNIVTLRRRAYARRWSGYDYYFFGPLLTIEYCLCVVTGLWWRVTHWRAPQCMIWCVSKSYGQGQILMLGTFGVFLICIFMFNNVMFIHVSSHKICSYLHLIHLSRLKKKRNKI